MAEPFLAEVRIFSFNFPPKGWAFCNGQLLPINQNQALFSLLGTTFGGNGQTNFALPDLRGRNANHMGAGKTLGERAGSDAVTITMAQMPAHNHFVNAVDAVQNSSIPSSNEVYANSGTSEFYAGTANTTMNPSAISPTGGSQPHTNQQPSLVLNFCIALQGIFPSQT